MGNTRHSIFTTFLSFLVVENFLAHEMGKRAVNMDIIVLNARLIEIVRENSRRIVKNPRIPLIEDMDGGTEGGLVRMVNSTSGENRNHKET